MTIEPDQIRARIAALLAELPGEAELAGVAGGLDQVDLEALAHRLKQAHDVLVHALESVERG